MAWRRKSFFRTKIKQPLTAVTIAQPFQKPTPQTIQHNYPMKNTLLVLNKLKTEHINAI
jgi:hypothetical protein